MTKNEGSGKLRVVELLVIGGDGIARGATVRVITNRKPIRISRPVHMKALSTRVSKRRGVNTDTAFVIGTQKFLQECFLPEM